MEFIGFILICAFIALVAGAICGFIALSRVNRLNERVSQLSSRFAAEEFKVPLAAAPMAPPALVPAPPPPVVPAPTPPPGPPPSPLRPEPVPVAAPPVFVVRPPIPAPAFAAAAAPKRTTQEWEAQLGGNWLNKLGVLVLVIGLALLLGYSFTHMGPGGIVAISLLGSAAMLAVGVVLEPRDRYRMFARGLISGGWAGLYVTVYSMHAVTAAKVVDNPVLAAVLLIAVAAGMIAHSLQYSSESVVGLAYFIAFATLAITQSTSLSLIALIPLAASLLWLARHFRWSRMALGGLIATYATVALRPDTGAPLWEGQAIFAVYWLLFEAFDILEADSWLLPLNAAGFMGLSLIKWHRADPAHAWVFLAAAAAAYLVSALLRSRRGRWQGAATLTAALGAAAFFQRLDHQWVASALVVEAELFYLAGIRLRAPYLRWLGTGLFGVEAARLGVDIATLPVGSWVPVASLDAIVFYANRFLWVADLFYGYAAASAVAVVVGFEAPGPYRGCWWLLTAAIAFMVGWWRRLPDLRRHGYLFWGLGLIGVGFALGKFSLSCATAASYALVICALRSPNCRMEAHERGVLRVLGSLAASAALAMLVWRSVDAPYLGIAWVALGVVVMELGVSGWPGEIRSIGIAVSALGICRILINDFPALQNHGALLPRLLPAVAGLLAYWISYRSRASGRGAPQVASWLGTGLLAVALWATLPFAWVGAAWASFALVLLAASWNWKQRELLGEGCCLASLAYGWVAVNLLDAGGAIAVAQLAGCAAAIAFLYGAQLMSPRGPVLRLYLSLLGSTLTSLLLYEEVSGRMLTIAWGIQGLCLLASGFPLRDRLLRVSGLVLLLVCILKLFVYDLRYLETLPRIVSFLALGLILVAVSWVYTRFRGRLIRDDG
jgi:hypothetical protein